MSITAFSGIGTTPSSPITRPSGEAVRSRSTPAPFLEYTDNPKNSMVATEGETYDAWKRYRVFMPNAMWLDSSAGPDEHYILFVAVAPV